MINDTLKGSPVVLDDNHGCMPCELCLAKAPAPGLDAARAAVDGSLTPRIPGKIEPHRLFLHRDHESVWHVATEVMNTREGLTMTTECGRALDVVGIALPAAYVPVANYCDTCTS